MFLPFHALALSFRLASLRVASFTLASSALACYFRCAAEQVFFPVPVLSFYFQLACSFQLPSSLSMPNGGKLVWAFPFIPRIDFLASELSTLATEVKGWQHDDAVDNNVIFDVMVFLVDKVQSSTLEFARINEVVVIILIRILTTTIALTLRGIPILLALFVCLYGLLGSVLSRVEQGKGSTVALSSQEVM
jgi:hypothetical protein